MIDLDERFAEFIEKNFFVCDIRGCQKHRDGFPCIFNNGFVDEELLEHINRSKNPRCGKSPEEIEASFHRVKVKFRNRW